MSGVDFLIRDDDPVETQEWLESLDAVIQEEGLERARFLLGKLQAKLWEGTSDTFVGLNTPYRNTIPVEAEAELPEDDSLAAKIKALIRWNAVMMVLHAGKKAPELGGHIATFASAATLYEVGFNHFFHAPTKDHPGDLIYFQGHASPGIYARAFLEGRLSEKQLKNFRQEIDTEGLSSYPHPWLMPDFWQFATVSMGLGPLQGIYQARFLKYLENRGLIDNKNRKVWVFCGDGEMDEPESLGALNRASREKLDNLVFVINCNLQRLDGLVNGNGKIIQELEAIFKGAGWNVIKVIWGSNWDPLFAADTSGLLLKRMEECVDGDYQNYKAKDGAYVRKNFFGKYPELLELVKHMSDEDIWRLKRGGHDPKKVYAAYTAAVNHTGQPTVILTKTIKGYGMGAVGEGLNTTHQQKKMSPEDLRAFAEYFKLDIPASKIDEAPFLKPPEHSPEMKYLHEKRQALGGYLPVRCAGSKKLKIPLLTVFESQLQGSDGREISTTMAFVRMLAALLKDKNISKHIVPIVPDESRTFGMEGFFRQIGIYSPVGQLYTPIDRDQVMYYKEAKNGQFLEEGITEAGSFCSWIAAATSYSSNDLSMIPFYIYYSMFGYQRIGDLAWAAGDMRARGFILGGTAGRTTLAGEGLQHQDGHNLLLFSVVPNCVCYDPAYAYELAVIIHYGMKRMYEWCEDVYYYVTLMNENYAHPAMPKGVEEGIIKGMYLFKKAPSKGKMRVQLMGSGAILNEVIAAAELLQENHGVSADIWSVTSFSELRREALEIERYNWLHPGAALKLSYIEQCLKNQPGPVIAVTDYLKLQADQICAFVPGNYYVLGTDGFGRSDTRKQLRRFFEVDRYYIAIVALKALMNEGKVEPNVVVKAMKRYKIDFNKLNPVNC